MFQYISGMESTTQLSIVPQCPKSIPSIHSMSPVHSNPCHISPWPRDEICKEYMKAFQECHVEAELIYVTGLNNQSDQPDEVYQFTSNGKIVRYRKYEQRYVTLFCQKFAGLVKHHRSFMLLLCFMHMLMCFYVCWGGGYVHWLGLVFACYRTPLSCSPSPSQETPCFPSEIVHEQEWGLQWSSPSFYHEMVGFRNTQIWGLVMPVGPKHSKTVKTLVDSLYIYI